MSLIREPLESQLIATLLGSPGLATTLTIDASDFLDVRNGAIYEALCQIRTDITPLTLTKAIRDVGQEPDTSYMEEIMLLEAETLTLEQLQVRAHQIRELRLRRDLTKELTSASHVLKETHTPLEDVLTKVNTTLTNITHGVLGKEKPTALDILKRADQLEPTARFPSGLTFLDENLSSHGMRHGQVWAVVAQYAGWKTTVSMNMAHALIQDGRSVMYVALEDNDIIFTEGLLSVRSGVPTYVIEDYHYDKIMPVRTDYGRALKESVEWLSVGVENRWRVYDTKYSVHNWQMLPRLVAMDKKLYNTDVVFIDYLQCWSEDHEFLAKIMQMIVRLAAEQKVCVVVLSQMSNASIQTGTSSNVLAAKGSGTVGAAVHVGFEIKYDREKSWSALDPSLLQEFTKKGVNHHLSMTGGPKEDGRPTPSRLVEIGIVPKKVRRGLSTKSYAMIDPASGKILLQYPQPRFHKDL